MISCEKEVIEALFVEQIMGLSKPVGAKAAPVKEVEPIHDRPSMIQRLFQKQIRKLSIPQKIHDPHILAASDVYSGSDLLLEDDIVTAKESAFMQGYMS